MRSGRKALNLTGQRFGRWSVLKRAANRGARASWHCRCSCGVRRIVQTGRLRNGTSQSCGCMRSELTRERMLNGFTPRFIHGYSNRCEYRSWLSMHQRCENRNNPSFVDYGLKGVSVCEGLQQFLGFISVLGERPSLQHSLGRFLDIGNYSCGQCDQCKRNGWLRNVVWQTRPEQDAECKGKKRQ